jgi:hypothetical protein
MRPSFVDSWIKGFKLCTLVDRKVAFLQMILDQLEHFMYLICLVVTANTLDFFPY